MSHFDNDFTISYERERKKEECIDDSYSLSLILIIIDEKYLKDQHEEYRHMFYKIEKLQKEYRNVRIICILIGIREILNRVDYTENYLYHDKSFCSSSIFSPLKKNKNEIYNEKNIMIINNKDLDNIIATLMVHYYIDTAELDNINQLTKYIFKCCKYLHQSKYRKPYSYFKVKPQTINHLKNIDINHKKNNNSTWTSQLMQINGISEDVSKKITQVFNSPFHLMTYLKKNNDEECLKDLIISSSYGERKLGKALSRKIYRVFSPNANPHHFVS
ncbi:hypothetical protein PFLG_00282 [Plasmodium falciparum RAJ116]|nr:hypothetical protein PFLG_00282 [Plasmodium falciparum RAJ116]